MIRLWAKMMLPLMGFSLLLWVVLIWIYDVLLIGADFRLETNYFRPHILYLRGLGRAITDEQLAILAGQWNIEVERTALPAAGVSETAPDWSVRANRGEFVAMAVPFPDQTLTVYARSTPSVKFELVVPIAPDQAVALRPFGNQVRDLADLTAQEDHANQQAVLVLVVAAIVEAGMLVTYLMWRLRGLDDALRRLYAGNLTELVPVRGSDLIDRVGRTCNAMMQRIQRLIVQQTDVLRLLTHEVRTPLARIDLAVHLARQGRPEDPHLMAVHQDVASIDRLIQELTRFIRIEHQVASQPETAVDLLAVIDEATGDWSTQHPGITVTRAEVTSRYVIGHRGLLVVAARNLLNNAARFSRFRVEIGALLRGTETLVWVDDDGPGVAEQDRERIFQPFVVLPGPGKPGLGLGLTIVHRIMESIGGRVTCMTSPLGGARFCLWLRTGSTGDHMAPTPALGAP